MKLKSKIKIKKVRNKKLKLKKSFWYMIEIFFSTTLVVYFLFLLLSNINTFNLDTKRTDMLLKQNVYNTYYIMSKTNILDKYLREMNFKKLKNIFVSLFPFPIYSFYIYGKVYIPFSVLDNNYLSDTESERKVIFHYFFPLGVDKDSIVVLDKDLNELPTKVSFNYFYFSYPYSITSLSEPFHCIFIHLKINNMVASNFKKLRLFLNNYEIKNFSWEIVDYNTIYIIIYEHLEKEGDTNWKVYFFFSNNSREIGKDPSSSLDTSNCDSFTAFNVPLNVSLEKAPLGTVYFNYFPKMGAIEGNFYFFLNFVVNINKTYIYERNIENSSITYNDTHISIFYPTNLIYGNKMEKIDKNKTLVGIIPVFYSDGNLFYEIINEIYK